MRGMVIREHWMPMNGVIEKYLCRRCHARIGRPYADLVTGVIDQDRVVCANEHEIVDEGDVVSAVTVAARLVDATMQQIEIRRNYGQVPDPERQLYGPSDFEGFD